MKRTPLKRHTPLRSKTPLKRGNSTLKKSRLKTSSRKKEKWEKLFKESKERCGEIVKDALTGDPAYRSHMDPHHPYGKVGKFRLVFIWITREFHNFIHDNSSKSMEKGWLQPAYRSVIQHNPHWPKPWKEGSLVGAEHLPENNHDLSV